MTSIILTLPIPPREISPNARRGESRFAAIKKSRIVKAHRHAACAAMKVAIARGELERAGRPLGYYLAHFFPTAQFRDEDNADGACKAYRDGICDALRINDKDFCKRALSTRAKDAKRPRVEITVYFAEAEKTSCENP
jgi:hypothetical protein